MKLGFYFNPIFLEHVDMHSPVHPESPERLRSVLEYLEKSDLNDHLVQKLPKRYDSYFIKQTHCERYFRSIYETLSAVKNGKIDSDTFYSSKTLRAALVAANTGIEAYKDIQKGAYSRAFCCIRPPGHHAVRNATMGFCFFNNIAVTANYLRFKGVKKILIVDFDVHHGNGTQDLFYEDDSVLFISLHQSEIYPFDGFESQQGMNKGEGFNLNFPMESTRSAADFLELTEQLAPIIRRFEPEALLVSAGFDAHKDDPIGGLHLESHHYYELTKTLIRALPRADIPIISHLEGGYSLQALPESVYYHLKALLEIER